MANGEGAILIANDDPKTVSVCRKELEKRGFTVHVCDDVCATERVASSAQPTVVLLDARLPGGDIHALCAHLREQLGAGVVVMLPPRTGPGEAASWGDCCDACLEPPFDVAEMGKVVESLRKRGSSAGGMLPAAGVGEGVDELPVSEIAGCRIERVLGRGAMGTVYLGRHVLLNVAVAIKLVSVPDAGWGDDAWECFLSGARAAVGIQHPHVTSVLNAGREGDFYYLVQRYVEGRSLREVVAGCGPLSEEGVTRLLAEMASALEAVHANGVVHCDVKPANIMVMPDGRASLVDFGLALRMEMDDIPHDGAVTGTPFFMSPEQCQALKPDGRSDLYSLGATAYYALTGRVPIPGNTLSEALRNHVMRAPVPVREIRPDVSVSLECVIMRLLAKSPDERLQSARALLDALADCGLCI